MIDRLSLTAPDDWHIHLRDGASLSRTVADCARQFRRAIVMPNLVPPVTNAAEAMAYKARILEATPAGAQFEPLMVLYLTDNTQPEQIRAAKAAGVVGVKLYPAGATTNSASGVTDLRRVDATLAAMAEEGLVLLIHGEVTHSEVDIFDREAVFIDTVLAPLLERHPRLKVVLEHITTAHAVEFVAAGGANLAATITAHHLLYNRNHLLAGGIRPHYYCLPVLKRHTHQQKLIEAAVSGNPKFFLGTDSAPHAQHKKEAACGCAGAYTAYAALEMYAEAFEDAGALDKLEGFASYFGADFYGFARNRGTVTLVREPWRAPEQLPYGETQLIPLRAGETLRWRLMPYRQDNSSL